MEMLDHFPVSGDDTNGAMARRKDALGTEPLNHVLIASLQLSAGLTESRAIDKVTAEELFRKYFPNGRKADTVTNKATHIVELDGGVIVYRLPNGDWIETAVGHFIPASFPWAQILEQALRVALAHPEASSMLASHTANTTQDRAEDLQKTMGNLRKAVAVVLSGFSFLHS
ncbi:MAG: hypothetical protein WCG83_01940 [Candidatus Peregrinibacteria bacterium]